MSCSPNPQGFYRGLVTSMLSTYCISRFQTYRNAGIQQKAHCLMGWAQCTLTTAEVRGADRDPSVQCQQGPAVPAASRKMMTVFYLTLFSHLPCLACTANLRPRWKCRGLFWPQVVFLQGDCRPARGSQAALCVDSTLQDIRHICYNLFFFF